MSDVSLPQLKPIVIGADGILQIGQIPEKTVPPDIKLSQYTQALLKAYSAKKSKSKPDEYTRIVVSQAVSFFAIVYEKIRNSIEYRDDHLVRRAAIERVLRRRISLHPNLADEGENLVRELLWARYFPNGSLSESDGVYIQKILNIYVTIKQKLLIGRPRAQARALDEFLLELITCEIEEYLAPENAYIENIFGYYLYQTIRNKIKIADITEDVQNIYLLAAIEKTYRKSDTPYQRYHLFQIFYQPLASYTVKDLEKVIANLPRITQKIDDTLSNKNVEKIARFLKKQLPPYLVLFSIINQTKKDEIEKIIHYKSVLWTTVERVCREKYAMTRSRLQVLAIRSLIYIFITKMVLAIALEGPLSTWIYGHVDYLAIAINTIAPPIFMLIIILFAGLPGTENTQRIYQRIIEIIDADPQYETKPTLITQANKRRRPVLDFGFGLFYSITFIVTLYLIHLGLKQLHFNLVSESIFIFFISTVAFFAQRITQVSSEYKLVVKDNILVPFVDFFFMPILALGKFFSSQVAKINFFTVLFDVIIEAPFKLLIEVIEEWIKFTRNKKEEIV